MDEEFYNLAKSLAALQKEAAEQTILAYKPEVERIIYTKSKDIETIERVLDALGEVAYDDKVLILFKKLLRYYFDFNPSSVARHIQWYRAIWDCENE